MKVFCLLLVIALSSFSQSLTEVLPPEASARSTVNDFGEGFIRSGNITLSQSRNTTSRSRSTASSIATALFQDPVIIIDLFEDLTVIAERKNSRTTSDGAIYWTGTAVSGAEGELSLYYRNGMLSGSLYALDRVYTISALSLSKIKVTEVDPSLRPDLTCGGHDDDEEKKTTDFVRSSVGNRGTNSQAITTIDILVVYPTATQNAAGGASAMDQEVNFRVAEANEIFINSEINLAFRLVHHEVNNDVPSSARKAGDVDIRSVNALRDKYGADLVTHWNSGGSAGSGHNYSGNKESAYNTSNFSDVKSRFTFVHECGHNMGGKHDRYTYREQGRASELRDSYYRYGYFMDGDDGNTYRTIMSYDQCRDFGIGGGCTRVKHFSNPDISYKGAVTGVLAPSSEAANNALRLNICGLDVATFRKSLIQMS